MKKQLTRSISGGILSKLHLRHQKAAKKEKKKVLDNS